MERSAKSAGFWKWHGCYNYKLPVTVISCTRYAQDEALQNSIMERKGAMSPHSSLRDDHQLMIAGGKKEFYLVGSMHQKISHPQSMLESNLSGSQKK